MPALILAVSLLATGLFAGVASATVTASSTFDSSTEGWTAITIDTAGNTFPSNLTFVPGTGNPGGAIRHDAPSDSRTSYLSAPPAVVAALRASVGGFISWEISTISGTNPLFFAEYDLEIRAGPDRIRRSVTPPPPPVSPTWVRYTAGLNTGASWVLPGGTPATQVQIDAVVAGADSLIIRGEYWSSMTPDTTFLDNVVVAGPGPAVILDRSSASVTQPLGMRLVGPPAGAVDLYVVVALPQALAAQLGCGNSIPLVFVANGGSSLTTACASDPPATFPRYLGGAVLPASMNLLSVEWPFGAPPGTYLFAAVFTPPGALADNDLGAADIIAIVSSPLTGL